MEVPRREPGNQTIRPILVAVTFFPTRAPFSFPGSRLGTHSTRGSASVSGGACKSWRFPGGSLGTRHSLRIAAHALLRNLFPAFQRHNARNFSNVTIKAMQSMTYSLYVTQLSHCVAFEPASPAIANFVDDLRTGSIAIDGSLEIMRPT